MRDIAMKNHSTRSFGRNTLMAAVAGLGLVLAASPAGAQQVKAIAVAPPGGAPMSFADLIDRVSPAVVSVSVTTEIPAAQRQKAFNPFRGLPGFDDYEDRYGKGKGESDGDSEGDGGSSKPEEDQEGRALGSGFFISAQGYIVTNNHVVEHAREVVVILKDGQELEAEIVGVDEPTDLAVLKVKKSGSYPFVEFSTKARPRVGDWVVAVGNPFGLGGTATAGIVSADGRKLGGAYNDFIQVDAPINRGNSGGPTFDLNGRVIGVNTAIFSEGGGSNGIGFAIEASAADKVAQALIKNGKIIRGWLGVEIQPINPQFVEAWGLKSDKGAVVSRVTKGGPAEQGGIRERDVIIAVNGDAIKDNRDLTQHVGALIAGSKNAFKVIRDGKEQLISVTVRERDPNLGKEPVNPSRVGGDPPKPQPSDAKFLGASTRPLSPAEVTKFASGGTGLLVVSVDRTSPLHEAGILPGDALLTLNDKPLKVSKDFEDAVAAARKDGKENVVLSVGCGDSRRCGDTTLLRPLNIKPKN
jgi:serine protease Do